MYTPPGFDEDTHAARYGFTLSHGDALPNDERTRCIEHNAYDCAECDADWIDLGKLTEHEAADILKYQVVTMERLEEWGACNPAITGANIMAAHEAL